MKLFLVLLHIVFGVVLCRFEWLGNVLAFIIPIIALVDITANKNRNNQAIMWALYFSSFEVGFRILNTLPYGYEGGKYVATALLLLGGLYNNCTYKYKSIWPCVLLALIPSCFIASSFENIRFSLSGILLLVVASYYVIGRFVSFNRFEELLRIAVLPAITLVVMLFIKTPDLSSISFISASIFETAGGFSPVHLTSALGCIMVFLFLFIFTRRVLFFYAIVDILLFLLILYRVLLSFSRSGLFAALIAIALFVIYSLWTRNVKLKLSQTIVMFILVSIGCIYIWTMVIQGTSGMAYNRFTGRNSAGDLKEDISTGRNTLIEQEMNAFYENPIFGIGAGNIVEYRIEKYADKHSSHTEYTRLLAEHGLFGLFILCVLVFFPLIWYKETQGYTRSMFVFFMIYSLIIIYPASTRISLPLLMYALAFFRIKEDYDFIE